MLSRIDFIDELDDNDDNEEIGEVSVVGDVKLEVESPDNFISTGLDFEIMDSLLPPMLVRCPREFLSP